MVTAIHEQKKKTRWKNGYDAFLWWMEDKNVEGQMSIADFAEESEW